MKSTFSHRCSGFLFDADLDADTFCTLSLTGMVTFLPSPLLLLLGGGHGEALCPSGSPSVQRAPFLNHDLIIMVSPAAARQLKLTDCLRSCLEILHIIRCGKSFSPLIIIVTIITTSYPTRRHHASPLPFDQDPELSDLLRQPS